MNEEISQLKATIARTCDKHALIVATVKSMETVQEDLHSLQINIRECNKELPTRDVPWELYSRIVLITAAKLLPMLETALEARKNMIL